MPYKNQELKLKIPRELDGRVKLTDEQRLEILEKYKSGGTFRGLGKEYGVDRNLIRLICVPERLARHKELAKLRRADGRYYIKEKQTEAIRRNRQKRQTLYLQNNLTQTITI